MKGETKTMEYFITCRRKEPPSDVVAHIIRAESPELLGVKLQELCELKNLVVLDVFAMRKLGDESNKKGE